MANNIYEFGGIADVILKFKTNKTVDGVSYQAGEPYTFLKDVDIRFVYDQESSLTGGKKNSLSANSGRPTQIAIGNIPFSRKIANLMLTQDNSTLYTKTKREKIFCEEEGKLMTHGVPTADTVFVYDSNFMRISVDTVEDSILYGNFEVNMEYLVFYGELCTGDKYGFEIPHYPYFELDIFMKGNNNKISNTIYMNFPALGLVSVPNFNIISGGMLNTPLVFNVIYTGQPEPIIVFEE